MRSSLLIALVVTALAGCHDDPSPIYPTSPAALDINKLSLGPGDKLALTVYYGSHNIAAAYTLDPTGKMSVQYIGDVQAGGKTVEDVRKEVQDRLADGYLQSPIVSLTITELNSQTISVSGMVAKTGNLKFTPGMSIVDVIAQSGGFTPLARTNTVHVTRVAGGVAQTYRLPVEQMSKGERPTFQMLPGDQVFVEQRAW